MRSDGRLIMKFNTNDRLEQKGYSIKMLSINDSQKVQELCNTCSDYFLLEEGQITGCESKDLFQALPPNKTMEDKFVIGLYDQSSNLVGIMDLVRDYPDQDVWMLGLLLISPKYRRSGAGRDFHDSIMKSMVQEKANTSRVGVLSSNLSACKFWSEVGYVHLKEVQIDIGTSKGKVVNVMTKDLESVIE